VTGFDLGALRRHAVAVAYRMVGSRTEAEDLAQEALVRAQPRLGEGDVRSPEAFITTITTRLAIDHLRSARVRREAYVGPWLPEPVLGGDDPAAAGDGARAAELADSLSFAFLVVLESLGPVERAAFLLHDVFAFDYGELGDVLDRSEPACRQLVSRARRRVAEGRPRFEVDGDEHAALLDRFLDAARAGDVDGLVRVLADDAVLVSDGGAGRKAARRPVVGVGRVARFVGSLGPRLLALGELRRVTVNGEPGFVVVAGGRTVAAGTIEVGDGRVRAVRWVLNPDKLGWVDVSDGGAGPSRRPR
jgi:RNA polymerase sigma-70 factor (ECF subfamily)